MLCSAKHALIGPCSRSLRFPLSDTPVGPKPQPALGLPRTGLNAAPRCTPVFSSARVGPPLLRFPHSDPPPSNSASLCFNSHFSASPIRRRPRLFPRFSPDIQSRTEQLDLARVGFLCPRGASVTLVNPSTFPISSRACRHGRHARSYNSNICSPIATPGEIDRVTQRPSPYILSS
ncbi:hypothetical protein L209DRAFT_122120 [Thermothelomyces heterothallicus CBS 203.75]